MQIACTLEHETIEDIDRAGRPYTLALTHYLAADTGERLRTLGRVINRMSVKSESRMCATESEAYGHDAPTSNHSASGVDFDTDDRHSSLNAGGEMLSWKLMKATEAACRSVCMGEEAADNWGCTYSKWGRWANWSRGFVAGWVNDGVFVQLTLTRRIGRLVRRRLAER
jgi:hypothetical protein